MVCHGVPVFVISNGKVVVDQGEVRCCFLMLLFLSLSLCLLLACVCFLFVVGGLFFLWVCLGWGGGLSLSGCCCWVSFFYSPFPVLWCSVSLRLRFGRFFVLLSSHQCTVSSLQEMEIIRNMIVLLFFMEGAGGGLCCRKVSSVVEVFSFSVMLYYEIKKESILLKMSTEFPLITDYPDWVWFLPLFCHNEPAVPTVSHSISVGLSNGANLGVLKRINILLSEVTLMPLPQCFNEFWMDYCLFVCRWQWPRVLVALSPPLAILRLSTAVWMPGIGLVLWSCVCVVCVYVHG